MDTTTYIKLRCGEYQWLCCIPQERTAELYDLVRGVSITDFNTILAACLCQQPPPTPAPPGPAGGGGAAPPGQLGDLRTQLASLTLPDICQDAKAFICQPVVAKLIKAICALIQSADPTQMSRPYSGLVALLQLICELYDLACTDDTSAAAVLLGLYAVDELVARAVITLPANLAGMGALSFMLSNLLTRIEAMDQESSCGAALLTANRSVADYMQSLITG